MVCLLSNLCIRCWSKGPLSFSLGNVYGGIVHNQSYVFFAWEAVWGKILTLDQLKRRGFAFANRCFLCHEWEETVDHLLLHCEKSRVLWELLFSRFGVSWVIPSSVRDTLLGWRGSFVTKGKRVWTAGPLCIFWAV